MAYTYANVNRVYSGLQSLVNKQQLGFVSPSQFNVLARIGQDNVFDSKIDQLNNQVKNKIRNLETVIGDLQNRAEDDLAPLFIYNETQTASSGTNVFDYPTNSAYIKGISYNGYDVDRINASQARYYTNSYYTPPTEKYLVALFGSGKIEVIGSTLASGVNMSYYKRPTGSKNSVTSLNYPTWGYTSVGENDVYNSATSYDFELPSHLEHELIMEIASLIGLNQRDTEVIQYAEGKTSKDEQNETAK